MVKDQQVRLLMKNKIKGKSLKLSSALSGLDEKTARKYLQAGKLPSQLKKAHTWRTRENPFEEVWEDISEMLRENEGFEAKTLFEYLQRKYPGRFQDGQIRTLQRHVKVWRALEGGGQEVYFPQKHIPGRLSESDFTRMKDLRITISGEAFDHMLYHFVLTYSNWEAVTVCFSESYESLSFGLQNALWKLGGVPEYHQTDCMGSAVRTPGAKEEFTYRYQGLLNHYRLKGKHIQSGKANENGDIEQSHNRFKKALEQSLLLRGSRDFAGRKEYELFLSRLCEQLNKGRIKRLAEESGFLRELPLRRLEDYQEFELKVGPSSTINIKHNTYSVHSRLKGEKIKVRIYAEHLEIWYAQRCVEKIPRLKGEGRHRIEYRHIIDQLIRKPGAFENYRYRSDMFPGSCFRMAYDLLAEESPASAARNYLKILQLAAYEGEILVAAAIERLISSNESINLDKIKGMIRSGHKIEPVQDVSIKEVDLSAYDCLLGVCS